VDENTDKYKKKLKVERYTKKKEALLFLCVKPEAIRTLIAYEELRKQMTFE
jgi:hypothetical protein